jgi:hypothetical protein
MYHISGENGGHGLASCTLATAKQQLGNTSQIMMELIPDWGSQQLRNYDLAGMNVIFMGATSNSTTWDSQPR